MKKIIIALLLGAILNPAIPGFSGPINPKQKKAFEKAAQARKATNGKAPRRLAPASW